MQTTQFQKLSLTLSLTLCLGVAIAAEQTAERAMLKEGKMVIVQDGKTIRMEKNVLLPHDIKVTTNGTFTVNNGKQRQLKEGQVLDSDGMLTSPDGSVAPVLDHVAMKNGKLVLVQDGEASAVDHEIAFPDGSKVSPDNTLRTPDGRLKRLIDGDLLTLGGQSLPSQDTISLQNGKVVVQKDGSLLTLRPDQSMMMNDGTKAFGNGTVISKNGTTTTLTEGQILKVEGVVTSTK